MAKIPLCLDVETTISNKGNVYDLTNKLVQVGTLTPHSHPITVEWQGTQLDIDTLQYQVNQAYILIAFNAKFDLNWLRRVGIDISNVKVWDCQLAEFLLNSQKTPYPSLDQAAEKYGFKKKLDIIKTMFWERSCSCHVLPVTEMLICMQKVFVNNAINFDITNQEKVELLKKLFGDKTIQKSIKRLNFGELKNYVLVLKHRIEQEEQHIDENITLQILNSIDLWLKQNVQFVETVKEWQLTTTTQQEKYENVCVEHVMLLLDMLKGLSGLNRHLNTCKSTPVDTDKIPPNILSEYLVQDLVLTQQVYEKQAELFQTTHKHLYPLFRLQCQDLLVLAEMEWNGILFNTKKAKEKADVLTTEIDSIADEFSKLTGGIPINLNSNDHVSCLLYGGTIVIDDRLPVGVFKTGAKIGQTRYKIVQKEYPLPRLVDPLKGTEVKDKEGKWLVNETVLRKLKLTKEAKKVVGMLNRYAELEKLRGTYLLGYAELIDKMNWEKDNLHGTLNQCVAITGRLSSTRPNLQNADPTTKIYMESRYVL